MRTDQRDPIDADAADLMAKLMEASLAETFGTTDRIIENLTRERDELRAQLDIVRSQVGDLLDADFMPTGAAIERAMWPRREAVERLVEARRKEQS